MANVQTRAETNVHIIAATSSVLGAFHRSSHIRKRAAEVRVWWVNPTGSSAPSATCFSYIPSNPAPSGRFVLYNSGKRSARPAMDHERLCERSEFKRNDGAQYYAGSAVGYLNWEFIRRDLLKLSERIMNAHTHTFTNTWGRRPRCHEDWWQRSIISLNSPVFPPNLPMMNMYHLMGVGVTEACLCVYKGEYNSNHVQGVSKDVDCGSPVFFFFHDFLSWRSDAQLHSA